MDKGTKYGWLCLMKAIINRAEEDLYSTSTSQVSEAERVDAESFLNSS